jgi:hypothetical protein
MEEALTTTTVCWPTTSSSRSTQTRHTSTSVIPQPMPETSSRVRVADHHVLQPVLQPSLIRTGTQWTKRCRQIIENRLEISQFPDASGRARTSASKLVAGAGVSGSQVPSSALYFLAICR